CRAIYIPWGFTASPCRAQWIWYKNLVMWPREPKTNGVFRTHARTFDEVLSIPLAAFSFEVRTVVFQIFHTLPAVHVMDSAKVILFFIRPPNRITEIPSRSQPANSSTIRFIKIHGRVCFTGCKVDIGSRLSIWSFDVPVVPKRYCITHGFNFCRSFSFWIG